MFFDDVDLLEPLADHPLNEGLSSLYLAMPNTGGANRFYDLKGKNHGTFVGNAFWYWDSGHAAPLIYIASGTQDGVQLDSMMALTSPFTIAAWVYPTTLTANSCIAGNYDGGNYWIFRQAATDGTKWEFSRNAENLFLAGAANTVTQNAWQLVVATWDGTNWVLYKNGTSIATNSNGTGPANGTQTYLARLPAGFNWNGLFGAFWHYERFFSEIDAYSLWQQCLQGFPDILRRNPDPWSFGVQATGLARTQGNFRFRNDDGDEDAATWRAAENANASVAVETPVRLRIQTDVAGDAPSEGVKLQYRKVGESTWLDVL